MEKTCRLKMLPVDDYVRAGASDPIMFYKLPVVGSLYKARVESCLSELTGGDRVLEVGFGSGVAFLNLNEKYKEIHGLDLDADAAAVSKAFEKAGIRTFLKNGDALNMPYEDSYFDSVLLISILEHLKPDQQDKVFGEIRRVLKKGGQVVYGAPVSRPFMKFLFRLLGYDIDRLHFSTEDQIRRAAEKTFNKVKVSSMKLIPFGSIYEIGHYIKT